LFNNYKTGSTKELRLIVKADVQGSVEPIVLSLNDMNKGEISVNVLHAETGNITENDVMLATASSAVIVGFNVKADASARRLAESEGISIRLYDIIYRLTEDVDKALKGMLEPEYKEVSIGKAEILEVFHISKVGSVAGGKVLQGEIRRNARVRIFHNDETIFEGEISSLKHQKENVKEVRTGFECGMSFKNFNDFSVGDRIECFSLEKVTL